MSAPAPNHVAPNFRCPGCRKEYTHGFFRGVYVPAKGQQPIPYRLCDSCADKLLHGESRDNVMRNIARRLGGGT
jgi:hypothetical protein